jgi:hypothetical protein
MPPHPISFKSYLLLSFHPILCLPNGLFASVIPTKMLYGILFCPCECHMPWQSEPYRQQILVEKSPAWEYVPEAEKEIENISILQHFCSTCFHSAGESTAEPISHKLHTMRALTTISPEGPLLGWKWEKNHCLISTFQHILMQMSTSTRI